MSSTQRFRRLLADPFTLTSTTFKELQTKIVPPAPTPSHANGTAGLVGMFVKPNCGGVLAGSAQLA